MDWKVLRERLRTAREQARVAGGAAGIVGMTLDQAAEGSGLNRATIHSIENVRREPDLKPELETIERLARTYGLTLSSFFAQIEGQTDGDLQLPAGTGKTAIPLKGTEDAGRPRAVSPAAESTAARTVAKALLDASMAITVALDGDRTERSNQSLSAARSTKRVRR